MLLAAPTPQPFLFKPRTTWASSKHGSSAGKQVWLVPGLYTALCSNPVQGREAWGRGFGGQVKLGKAEGWERISRQTGLKTTMVGLGRGSLGKTRGWEQTVWLRGCRGSSWGKLGATFRAPNSPWTVGYALRRLICGEACKELETQGQEEGWRC